MLQGQKQFIMLLGTILLLFFFFSALNSNAQCAMCKAVMESSEEPPPAINAGIIYIMFVPYLLLIFLFREKIVSVLKEFFRKKTW